MMRWLRELWARLRRPRPAEQVTPAPAPEAEPTKAEWRYSVIVGRPGQPDQTYPGHVTDHAVQKNEPLVIGGVEYVVIEIVEQAEPGRKDGVLRAKPVSSAPTTAV